MEDQLISVLLVDDEAHIREALSQNLDHAGMTVKAAADGYAAIEQARGSNFEVALVDLNMPGLPGLETVRGLRRISPDTEMVILTGHASVESSVEAMRENVFDYLRKPADVETIVRTILRAAERRRLRLENRRLVDELERERNGLKRRVAALEGSGRALSSTLVGESDAIRQLRRFIEEVRDADITVLIRGESGTGKDIVARLIHEADGRDGSFVKINCPTIPEALLESELFGHEPGAFTGAERRKPGRFELAAGGTIFLDEIGEIPGGVQSKLLQAIEHKQFTRLGGGATINTDARIVAATNAPLEDMIVERRFRSDLFYRLNQYAIELPPLRERSEDVPLLIDHFLQIYGVKHARPDLTLSPAMMSRLVRYSWPGNVRELEAVMHRFVLTGREDAIESAMERKPERARKDSPLGELRQSEIRTLMAALTEARWNQRQAAGILGISYSSLRRRVKKYNLKLRWLQEHKSAGEP